MSNVFFTADTHFNHENIIKYCNRPFLFKEHDEKLIENWNSVVKKNDVVYHLGDFAFVKSEYELKNIVSRLHGKIHLIKGNHDRLNHVIYHNIFESVKDMYELNFQKEKIILCHYAMMEWKNSHHGSWCLHGHSHGNLNTVWDCIGLLNRMKIYDVGVDSNNFIPVSFDKIKSYMNKIDLIPIHHITNKEQLLGKINN